MPRFVHIIILFSVVLMLHGCSQGEQSKEDEIKSYISSAVEAAENRNAGDLANMIQTNYLDEKGLHKNQLVKLIKVYFFRHKNIYLLTKIRGIKFHNADEAEVTLHVAMAGKTISDASVLSALRAKIVKFELILIKDNEWLLHKAKWRPASIGDMR